MIQPLFHVRTKLVRNVKKCIKRFGLKRTFHFLFYFSLNSDNTFNLNCQLHCWTTRICRKSARGTLPLPKIFCKVLPLYKVLVGVLIRIPFHAPLVKVEQVSLKKKKKLSSTCFAAALHDSLSKLKFQQTIIHIQSPNQLQSAQALFPCFPCSLQAKFNPRR